VTSRVTMYDALCETQHVGRVERELDGESTTWLYEIWIPIAGICGATSRTIYANPLQTVCLFDMLMESS
jgi:hypothetical protein